MFKKLIQTINTQNGKKTDFNRGREGSPVCKEPIVCDGSDLWSISELGRQAVMRLDVTATGRVRRRGHQLQRHCLEQRRARRTRAGVFRRYFTSTLSSGVRSVGANCLFPCHATAYNTSNHTVLPADIRVQSAFELFIAVAALSDCFFWRRAQILHSYLHYEEQNTRTKKTIRFCR